MASRGLGGIVNNLGMCLSGWTQFYVPASYCRILGGDNNLALIVGRYTPGHNIAMKCKGQKEVTSTCRSILDSMNVSTSTVKYGLASDSTAQEEIPWTMYHRRFIDSRNIKWQCSN